jgi:serine/threonine protein kinase
VKSSFSRTLRRATTQVSTVSRALHGSFTRVVSGQFLPLRRPATETWVISCVERTEKRLLWKTCFVSAPDARLDWTPYTGTVRRHQDHFATLGRAGGLTNIRALGIVHGDIKLENILVFFKDGAYEAKLTDFESSSICSSDDDLILLPMSAP